jgi:hypothetical protein
MKRQQFYCVKCQKKRACNKDTIHLKKDKLGKPRLVSKCGTCGTKVFKYVKAVDVAKLKRAYK